MYLAAQMGNNMSDPIPLSVSEDIAIVAPTHALALEPGDIVRTSCSFRAAVTISASTSPNMVLRTSINRTSGLSPTTGKRLSEFLDSQRTPSNQTTAATTWTVSSHSFYSFRALTKQQLYFVWSINQVFLIGTEIFAGTLDRACVETSIYRLNKPTPSPPVTLFPDGNSSAWTKFDL